MWVQIRLPARKGDLNRACFHRVDLIKIGGHIVGRKIDEMIGGRAAGDIAIGALNIAERSGVEPECFEVIKLHPCALLAFGRDAGVGEFAQRLIRGVE